MAYNNNQKQQYQLNRRENITDKEWVAIQSYNPENNARGTFRLSWDSNNVKMDVFTGKKDSNGKSEVYTHKVSTACLSAFVLLLRKYSHGFREKMTLELMSKEYNFKDKKSYNKISKLKFGVHNDSICFKLDRDGFSNTIFYLANGTKDFPSFATFVTEDGSEITKHQISMMHAEAFANRVEQLIYNLAATDFISKEDRSSPNKDNNSNNNYNQSNNNHQSSNNFDSDDIPF